MIQYTVRRMLLAIPVLLAILIVVFLLARAVPGDPCKSILGEKATAETCERFTKIHGLDKPVPVQLAIYMSNMLRGDFGDSIRFKRPVLLMLAERLPMTIELGMAAMTLALLVGIPAGILSAVRRNSAIDVVTMFGANIGVSLPVFFLGLLLIYLFAVVLRDTPFSLPPSGRLSPGVTPTPFFQYYELAVEPNTGKFYFYQFIAKLYILNSILTKDWVVLKDTLRHLLLPAIALATIPLAIIARMTRSSMLEILGLDYIRTAKAKGLPQRMVIMKHSFRNALLPIVTIAGLQMAAILGGAVLTETIFSLPGVGLSVYEAITARDFPVIQGFVLVIAFIYVSFNLIVDLSYAILDPRIRLN
ncbi:MAG: ABC transporter permease [Chloroflexi bacterium]|nr:ABC transporter permease [Ardenticatenaceae bacterium]MBL1127192.1 ABC transporter permease [Chloroflexota bacterium]NOG33253.1 ABC transporter permease [Chloroflexota bacterium]